MIFERFRASQRHVFGEVDERRARGGRDELGAGDRRVRADRRDHFGGGHARVVLDVGRDLDAVGELEAERADVELRAQAARDLLRDLQARRRSGR